MGPVELDVPHGWSDRNMKRLVAAVELADSLITHRLKAEITVKVGQPIWDKNSWAEVPFYQDVIILTPKLFGRINDRPRNPKFFMPSYHQFSTLSYVMLHELGHVYDFRKTELMIENFKDGHDFWGHPVRADEPPWYYQYGKTSHYDPNKRVKVGTTIERYAEAFAEWHLTRGQTRIKAVRWYAVEYGWRQSW